MSSYSPGVNHAGRKVDLDLDFIGRRGRSPSTTANAVREVTSQDLAGLDEVKGSSARTHVRLRDSHHALARLLAAGASGNEASAVTGYAPSTISILKNDPAFQDLLEFYRKRLDAGIMEELVDYHTRQAMVRNDALAELHQRLVEKPDEIATGTILETVKVLSDRSGFGPQTKNTQVNVNVDLAGRLERARARVISHE